MPIRELFLFVPLPGPYGDPDEDDGYNDPDKIIGGWEWHFSTHRAPYGNDNACHNYNPGQCQRNSQGELHHFFPVSGYPITKVFKVRGIGLYILPSRESVTWAGGGYKPPQPAGAGTF